MSKKDSIYFIKQHITTELDGFEDHFRSYLKSSVPLLDRIVRFIIRTKGKQIRPILVFLSAKMIQEQTHEKTYRAATLLELLHTATLVHDDVVDDSLYRRNFFSINALWKNKIGVLIGDFLLSKSLLLCVDNNDIDLLKFMSEAVKKMSEGELLQIEKARKLDITEEVYYDIIEQKTAILLATCCACGAASVTSDKDLIDTMYHFGMNLGMAFQIKDDLFDYTVSNLIGKPVGQDIRERKMTLPLIYAMNNSEEKVSKWLKQSVKRHNKKPKRVRQVIQTVIDKGGVDYASQKMNSYVQAAKQNLADLPDTVYKESMHTLIQYVIERKN